ncbi:MAG: hypothetical protein AAB554_00715 [Patescibacteria group bacterium]
MRRRIAFASAALALAFASPAAAEKLARVEVTPRQVTFTVMNPSPFLMTCTGQLVGITKKGKKLVVRLDRDEIQPGGERSLSLYSWNHAKDPFIDGWSDMVCDAPNPEDSE